MPVCNLTERLWFPPIEEAEDDGLLAVGGDLGAERLLLAYRSGIFPWFNDDEIPMWWSPDPRFVLFPDDLRISRSMKNILNSGRFQFKINHSFESVIDNCKHVRRKDQDGTWITDEIKAAYTTLHHKGYVHCAEAWQDGKLAGGLYGVLLGKVFYGESMFTHKSNASKFAFINWVEFLKTKGVSLIDCQVYTQHLESLGAKMISRNLFMELIPRLNK